MSSESDYIELEPVDGHCSHRGENVMVVTLWYSLQFGRSHT